MNQPIIWIATNNENKVREFQEMLSNYEVKSLLDLPNVLEIEETGTTFAENAMLKAKTLATYLNTPAIGDDSGLTIPSLNNFPGIYSKRWAEPIIDDQEINAQLLLKMKDETQRQAFLETVIAYYNPKTESEMYFSGKISGKITIEPRGEIVFGYDQIFELEKTNQTLSELAKSKNQVSHRHQAIEKFIAWLEKEKTNAKKS